MMIKRIALTFILLIIPSTYAFSAPPYNYYLGPWVWESTEGDEYWHAPKGTVASLDLRTLSSQEKKGIVEGFGFFAVDGTLPSPYVLVGSGDILNIIATTEMKDAIQDVCGFLPEGST